MGELQREQQPMLQQRPQQHHQTRDCHIRSIQPEKIQRVQDRSSSKSSKPASVKKAKSMQKEGNLVRRVRGKIKEHSTGKLSLPRVICCKMEFIRGIHDRASIGINKLKLRIRNCWETEPTKGKRSQFTTSSTQGSPDDVNRKSVDP